MKSMIKRPAIFLDRDGTLIDDVGYIRKPSEVVFYPFTIEALKMLKEHFMFFIITNQSGIAKGLTTEEEVAAVNAFITDSLLNNGIGISDVFCCPHNTEDNCICKKPKTYFIEKACELYNIDLSGSYIIGDHPSDVNCGLNAGITPIYLLSGHGEKHRNEIVAGTLVFDNLLLAAASILDNLR